MNQLGLFEEDPNIAKKERKKNPSGLSQLDIFSENEEDEISGPALSNSLTKEKLEVVKASFIKNAKELLFYNLLI